MTSRKLFLLCSFAATALLAGCGGGTKCDHEYVGRVTLEPTTSADGVKTFTCSKCNHVYTEKIPLLSNKDYSVSEIAADCHHGGGDMYHSDVYGDYIDEKTPRGYHSTYAGQCSKCGEIVNGLNFKNSGAFLRRIATGGGYPRLYALKNGNWLLGYDNGTIRVSISENDGVTWSTPVCAAQMSGFALANVDFFEMDNGDILCSYRAIGNSSTTSTVRALHSSISHDGGLTWEYCAQIVSNYDLGFDEETVRKAMTNGTGDSRCGFFEPFVGLINDKVTVVYADDFTPMAENKKGSVSLNYCTQYLVTNEFVNGEWTNRKIIMDGTIDKTPTDSGLNPRVSRDGMPVFDRMSDGTYVCVFEGTYRDNIYPRHDFEILMSYSRDGITWSNPVEVYTPSGQGTKASAPYVCVSSDDRLIISFQTDEDSFAAGTGTGDGVSIMKVIISDGTPIDKIRKDNFYQAYNPSFAQPGEVAAWNGMMYLDDIIYIVTGKADGIYMNSSEVPQVLDPINSYCADDPLPVDEYTVRGGSAVKLSNGFTKTTGEFSLLIDKNQEFQEGSIETTMLQKLGQSSGLIFGAADASNRYFEMNSGGYFAYLVDKDGVLVFGEVDSDGQWTQLKTYDKLVSTHTQETTYTLKVELDENGNANFYCNGKVAFQVLGIELYGTNCGVRSDGAGAMFSPIKIN